MVGEEGEGVEGAGAASGSSSVFRFVLGMASSNTSLTTYSGRSTAGLPRDRHLQEKIDMSPQYLRDFSTRREQRKGCPLWFRRNYSVEIANSNSRNSTKKEDPFWGFIKEVSLDLFRGRGYRYSVINLTRSGIAIILLRDEDVGF